MKLCILLSRISDHLEKHDRQWFKLAVSEMKSDLWSRYVKGYIILPFKD